MRFYSKTLFLLPLLLAVTQMVNAQNYGIEELTDENAATPRPFSIARVETIDQGLRLFLSTDNPDGVARLLSGGALQAQLSDHQSESTTNLPVSLKKVVWCSEDSRPVYLAFADPLPNCGGTSPVRIEYFFEVFAILGPGRDLAIGQDPDFLWLIEER